MTAVQMPPLDLARIEDEAGVEFADGQIVEKPMSADSSQIEAVIVWLLMGEARKTRTAWVFPSSMGYQCFADDPRKFRKPDVSVVRAERMAGLDPNPGLIPIPPDLAVEVLSPNDLAYDIDAKIEEYLRNGFRLIWVVHPVTRSVLVHRADGSVSLLHEHDEITGESALPGFRCKVAEFFANPA